MYKTERPIIPMTIRIDSTPSPQQRIMIVDAIVHEWKRLPVRKYATLLYKSNLQIIRGTIEAIKANPPTYSTLHQLYDKSTQHVLGEQVQGGHNVVIPCMLGFVSAAHIKN